MKRTKVGFTGTQQGMNTYYQLPQLEQLLLKYNPTEFHHGDCIGADAQAHELVRRILPSCIIVVHPPLDSSKRAFCMGDITYNPRPYLERNDDIVKLSDILIATPKEIQMVLRSGTWTTVRYAQKAKLQTHIIFPRALTEQEATNVFPV